MKFEWFQIWNIDQADADLQIWRIEVRAGKKHLKDWNVKSFTDLEARIGDVFAHTLSVCRHVVPSDVEKKLVAGQKASCGDSSRKI